MLERSPTNEAKRLNLIERNDDKEAEDKEKQSSPGTRQDVSSIELSPGKDNITLIQ